MCKNINIATTMFDDEKIALIESLPKGNTVLVIWLKLLCLAGKMDNGGYFCNDDKMTYNDKTLSKIFHKKQGTVTMAFEKLQSIGMIEVFEDGILITNWKKYQNNTDYKSNAKERVARYRERKKNKQCNVTSNVTSNVTVTLPVTQKEKKEEKGNKEKVTQKETNQKEEIKEKYYTHINASERACENINYTINNFKSNTGLIDAYEVDNFDYNAVESEIKKSKNFLQNVTCFNFFVENYERVISGGYRDFLKPKNFENERRYTTAEYEELFTDVDSLDI